ncbi:NosD domain-containing protein, partial [Spirochaetota bacterium]
DTLYVFEGEYNESINLLNKTNVTMVAYPWITSTDNTKTALYGSSSGIGIYISNSSGSTFRGFMLSNWNTAVKIYGASRANVIADNILRDCTSVGLYIENSMSYNTNTNNTIDGIEHGVMISNSHHDYVARNIIRNCTKNGVFIISNSFSNTVVLNTITNNTLAGIHVSGSSFSNECTHNNIMYHDTNLLHSGAGENNYLSNYFGYMKLSSVEGTIIGTNTNGFVPYRLGFIGITQGDTTPPPVPVFTNASNTSSGVELYWGNVGGGVDGYRIYRSTTNTWTNFSGYLSDVGNVTVWTDTSALEGVTNYYFITSYDNPGVYENESWFSAPTNGYKVPSGAVAVYVAPNGNNAWPGTLAQPYSNIHYALTNLNGYSTVYVMEGVYNEQVDITNSGISVISYPWYTNSNSSAVVIDASGNSNGFYLSNSHDISIQGFTVKSSDSNGIYIENGSNNTISYNNIYSNQRYGIHLFGAETYNNLIFSNTTWGANQDNGIFIQYGSHGNRILSNIVRNNSSTGAGIYIYIGSNNIISYNRIYSNGMNGIRLNTSSTYNNIISSNTICGLNQDIGISIGNGAHDNVIVSNIIRDNEGQGIFVGGPSNTISYNRVYSNSNYGIRLSSAAANNNLISSNTVWGANQDYGIYLENDCYHNMIFSNIIKNNDSHGVSLNSSSNFIFYNQIYSNSGGMFLIGVISNIISSNTIWGANSRGFEFQAFANNNIIRLNTITNCSTDGIYLANSDYNIFELNNIHGQNYNINLLTSDGNSFFSNYFSSIKLSSIEPTFNGTNKDAFVPYRLGYIGITQDDAHPPPIPSFTYAYGTVDGVSLGWDDVGEGVAGYRIYKSTTNTWTNFDTYYTNLGNVNTWIDTNASDTETSYYFITSYDSAAPYENESWFSSSKSGKKSIINDKVYKFPTNAEREIWVWYSPDIQTADPPDSGPATGSEVLTNAGGTLINEEGSDPGYLKAYIAADYSHHRFQIKIIENASYITNIYIEWRGYNEENNGGAWVWDDASSNWIQFGTTTKTTTVNLSTNINNNITNYIEFSGSDQYLHFLASGVIQGGGRLFKLGLY